MASVFKKRGSYVAQVVREGRRIPATLGKLDRSGAALARQMLSQLERSQGSGSTPSAAVTAWLDSLDLKMYAAVVRLGLAEPRYRQPIIPVTLEKLCQTYLANRPDLSARAVNNIQQAMDSLGSYAGPGMMAARFTAADAKAWRRSVASRYSAPTVSGFVKKARQVFAWAMTQGIVKANPMDGLPAGQQVNEDRSVYVPADVVHAVIQQETDERRRLLIAMSRFGGIRIPSEAAAMRWSDIDWKATPVPQMTIRSPKTRGQGKASRRVPISDELKPFIRQAEASRDVDEDRVFPFIGKESNLRTRLLRAIDRAGLTPWPRAWHNLRASCQTDLEDFLPTHVACRFMGNSPSTSRKHYLQTKHEHWLKAAAQTAARSTNQYAQNAQSTMNEPRKTNENAAGGMPAANLNYPQGDSNHRKDVSRKRRDERMGAAQAAAQDAISIERRSREAFRRIAKAFGGGR